MLLHAFPDASIPVVQLSLNAFKSFDHHLELGRTLAALREQGVLIIGSSNIVHNLRAVDFARPDAACDWAQRFDDAAREVLTADPTGVAALDGHAAGSISMAAYTLGLDADPPVLDDAPAADLPVGFPATSANI